MARRRTIGVLSRETGVKVTTIRYYETIGLIDDPGRTESGQRVYGTDAVDRLGFIRHARDLGFSMEAIQELIALQTKPGSACTAVDAIARRQLAAVRERLNRLEALEAELKRMLTTCEGGTVGTCTVMESLTDHRHCTQPHGTDRSASVIPNRENG
ncbi:MerR family transcriptional regulator [Parvularcula oceani]|uniref:MerR family transcriptional regulator n=1 Tax=Parvularcula oceani TaxID=1247963 RepID=UPI00056B88E5|nr:helix-turn-helix domain-containing protein [Parvularcula oceani]